MRPEIAPILGHVQAEYLVGLTLPALQKRLRELGSDSVVLTLRLFPGRRRSSPICCPIPAALIAAASSAPVYTPVETFMGTGVVGGRMLSYEQIGRQTGTDPGALVQRAARLAALPEAALPCSKWIGDRSNAGESILSRFRPMRRELPAPDALASVSQRGPRRCDHHSAP